jgi:hypothetical protein
VFWASLFPRRAWAVCAASGVLFTIWKSPLPEPLLAWWNAHGAFPVSRVVDVTDLAALAVLPFAYRLSLGAPPRPRRLAATISVAVVSLLAFVATSVPHYSIRVPPDDPLRRFEFQGSVRQLVEGLKGCGLSPHLQSDQARGESGTPYLSLSFTTGLTRPKKTVLASAILREVGDRVLLEFESAEVFRQEEPVDEIALLREIDHKVRSCLGLHFVAGLPPELDHRVPPRIGARGADAPPRGAVPRPARTLLW